MPPEPPEPRTPAGSRPRAGLRSGGVPEQERAHERPQAAGRPARIARDGAFAWRVTAGEGAALWHEIGRHAEGATFFHTPVWAAVCEATFPAWRRAPLVLEFSDGNLALVPFLARRRPFAGVGHKESMLPGVYGGPLFLHAPGEAHWRACWEAVDELPDVFVYGNPFLAWRGAPRGERRLETTRVLDLGRGWEETFRRFRYSYRCGIRAARQRGFEASIAEGADEVEAYDRIYRDSLRRWGRRARGFHPKRLFHNLFEAGRSAPIRLWLVKQGGEAVGGAWVLSHGEHADYWHAAVRSIAMIHYPMHLLVAAAVERACSEGARWFDFNPSGGLAGVELFKRGFNAEVREFPVYSRFRPLAQAYRTWRRVCEKRLGRCPL